MEILHISNELKARILLEKQAGRSIGFVPTMGALHKGHLSLVKKAKKACDVVVVSIYVNPTQFNVKEDLDKYPRTLKEDAKKLTGFADLIFNPKTNEEVYGDSMELKEYDFDGLDQPLEGSFRPGHFKGMANVVSKLFSIVQPDKAFFGLKDYQQFLLVKKMVEIDNHPVDVIGCSIIRESHGLAMSSRNERLTPKGREAAGIIFYALNFVRKFYSNYSVEELQTRALFLIDGILDVEYLEFRNADTLEEITELKKGVHVFLSFAGYIDEVRLIDNIRFEVE